MALIECWECKKQISSAASSCPHCGAPLNPILDEKAPSHAGAAGLRPLSPSTPTLGVLDREDRTAYLFAGAAVVVAILGAGVIVTSSSSASQKVSTQASHESQPSTDPDTPVLSKSIDSIMLAIPLAAVHRVREKDLVIPIALINGLPSNSQRRAWLAEAQKQSSYANQTVLAAPIRSPTPLAPVQMQASRAIAGCSTHRSLVANVWLGGELFLASDCSPIGKIAGVQDDYHFPDGRVRDAILISFTDGSADWIPRKTAQLLYLTQWA
jgi:hypothetical protein